MAWGKAPASLEWMKRLKSNDPTLTTLFVMKFRKLTDDDWKEACEALKSNTCLKVMVSTCSIAILLQNSLSAIRGQELMASGHSLSEPVLSAFSEMLKANAALQRLGLGDEALGDHGMTILAPSLVSNRGLTDLELDCKGIGTEGAAALAAVCSRQDLGSRLSDLLL